MAIDVENFDLGSLEFWNHPAEERDRAFAVLRREAPISHHQPPDNLLEVEERDERGYWAVVRYDDIRHVSRNPDLFFVLLSVAGNDTTRHTTSHAMRQLTLHPDQRPLVLESPTTAVEEFVRWATPVLTFRRTATQDTELHGVPIAEGDKVVLFYHSGNRDEDAFEDPWRFHVLRDPNHHVGFGGGGPHYCLGASLARTQLRSIFTELLTRAPDIEAGEPDMFKSASFIHGVKRMPCSFTRRA